MEIDEGKSVELISIESEYLKFLSTDWIGSRFAPHLTESSLALLTERFSSYSLTVRRNAILSVLHLSNPGQVHRLAPHIERLLEVAESDSDEWVRNLALMIQVHHQEGIVGFSDGLRLNSLEEVRRELDMIEGRKGHDITSLSMYEYVEDEFVPDEVLSGCLDEKCLPTLRNLQPPTLKQRMSSGSEGIIIGMTKDPFTSSLPSVEQYLGLVQGDKVDHANFEPYSDARAQSSVDAPIDPEFREASRTLLLKALRAKLENRTNESARNPLSTGVSLSSTLSSHDERQSSRTGFLASNSSSKSTPASIAIDHDEDPSDSLEVRNFILEKKAEARRKKEEAKLAARAKRIESERKLLELDQRARNKGSKKIFDEEIPSSSSKSKTGKPSSLNRPPSSSRSSRSTSSKESSSLENDSNYHSHAEVPPPDDDSLFLGEDHFSSDSILLLKSILEGCNNVTQQKRETILRFLCGIPISESDDIVRIPVHEILGEGSSRFVIEIHLNPVDCTWERCEYEYS